MTNICSGIPIENNNGWNENIEAQYNENVKNINQEFAKVNDTMNELDQKINQEILTVKNRFNTQDNEIQQKLNKIGKSYVQVISTAESPFQANTSPFKFQGFFEYFLPLRGGRIVGIMLQATCFDEFDFLLQWGNTIDKVINLHKIYKNFTPDCSIGEFYSDRSPKTPIEFKYGDIFKIVAVKPVNTIGHIGLTFLIEYDEEKYPKSRGTITIYSIEDDDDNDGVRTINVQTHPIPDDL